MQKLRILKKYILSYKKPGKQSLYCISLKHTKTRKELSVLQLNQTIQTRNILKTIIFLWEKPEN